MIILPIIAIGAAIASSYLQRKPKQSFFNDDRPTTLALRGSFVPLLFGRQRLGPVFAWAGDREIQTHSAGKNLFGGGGSEQTVSEGGWHILCIGPCAELTKIVQNGIIIFNGPITPTDTPSGSHISMLNGNGDAAIWWGEFDQDINTFLAPRVGVASQWPHICSMIWNKKNLGSSTTWQSLEYEMVYKIPDSPLTMSTAWMDESVPGNLDDGVNPAHALRQLLTGAPPHGLGLASNLLDAGAFEALGVIFQNEHLVLNAALEDGMTASDFISQMMTDYGFMLCQVGDVLVPYAIRNVDAESLPTIVNDAETPPLPDRVQVYDDSRPSRLIFTFKGRLNNYRDQTLPVDDDAMATLRNLQTVQTIQINSVVDGFTANKIAQRRTLELTASHETYTLTVNRDAVRLAPGQAFILADIGQMRLGSIQLSPNSPSAKLECAFDQYSGLPGSYLPDGLGSATGTPLLAPAPDVVVQVMQIPTSITGGALELGVARIRANPQIAAAPIWISRDGTTYTQVGSQDTCASGGTLNNRPMLSTEGPTTITAGPSITSYNDDIQNVLDFSSDTTSWEAGQQICIIDNEVFFLQNITAVSGGWQLNGMIRAQLGTTAADHAINAPVFIIPYASIVPQKSLLLASGATIYVKTQPSTVSAAVDLSTVTAVTITLP